MDVPSSTIDFINLLKKKYPDELSIEPTVVGTPDYWKYAGVVELLREVEYYLNNRRS